MNEQENYTHLLIPRDGSCEVRIQTLNCGETYTAAVLAVDVLWIIKIFQSLGPYLHQKRLSPFPTDSAAAHYQQQWPNSSVIKAEVFYHCHKNLLNYHEQLYFCWKTDTAGTANLAPLTDTKIHFNLYFNTPAQKLK